MLLAEFEQEGDLYDNVSDDAYLSSRGLWVARVYFNEDQSMPVFLPADCAAPIAAVLEIAQTHHPLPRYLGNNGKLLYPSQLSKRMTYIGLGPSSSYAELHTL